jgi:hypothetical protein
MLYEEKMPMTEAEWLASDEPQTLIEFAAQNAVERRCRLLAAALGRYVLPLVGPECGHRAVEAAEAFADGAATAGEMRATWERAADAYCTLFPSPAPVNTEAPLAFKAASIALQATMFAASGFDHYLVSCLLSAEKACVRRWLLQAGPDEVQPSYAVMMSWQLALVRDIFRSPFRRARLDPAQRTPTVVSLARAAYDERHLPSGELEPHRLAVLADALEEAGAQDEVVAHLRSPGPHVRGCWAIDAVLGLS